MMLNLGRLVESCIPWIDISSEVLCESNGDCMPKLQPREVDVPIYPNGAHSFWHFIS